MLAYVFLLAVPVVAALSPVKVATRHRPIALALFALLIVLFVGLRHETGGDWYAYERSYWMHGALPIGALVDQLRDPGYYWPGWLLYRSGLSIHWLNVLCAAILAGGLLRFVRGLVSPWLGIVAAVPYLIVVVGMGYTRQAAAIGFVLMAFTSMRAGRIGAYVWLVLLAALMHRTAIVLLPVALLVTSRSRLATALSALVATGCAFGLLIGEEAGRLWGSYVESDYASAADGAPIRVAMNALAGGFFLLFARRLASLEERRFWTVLSVAALACIPALTVSMTAVDRIALYLLPLQLYVAGQVLRVAPSSVIARTGIALGVCAAYSAVLAVWLAFASHSTYWLPYRNVLVELLLLGGQGS